MKFVLGLENLSQIMFNVFYRQGLVISQNDQQKLKLLRAVLGYVFEDSGQNIVQYFFKEKYLLEADVFIFVKALVTLGSATFTLYSLVKG